MPSSDAGAPRRLGLRPHQRLHDPRDFQRAYAARQVLPEKQVVAYVRPNGLPQARLGTSVSRKLGNAVRRNRIKRVLREAFRLTQEALPAGYDYVLVPRKGAGAWRTADLRAALTRIGQRLRAKGSPR